MLHEMNSTPDVHTLEVNNSFDRGFNTMQDNRQMGTGYSDMQDNRMNQRFSNMQDGMNRGFSNMQDGMNQGFSNMQDGGMNQGFSNVQDGMNRGFSNMQDGMNQGFSNVQDSGMNNRRMNPGNPDMQDDSVINPAFTTMPADEIDPGFSVFPENNRPNSGIVTLPGNVRPGFGFPPSFIPGGPGPVIPCPNCRPFPTQNVSVRFLNASPIHSNLTIQVDNQIIMTGLEFAEVSRYRQYSRGFRRVTVLAPNGFVFLQQNVFLENNSTIAIVSSNNRMNLVTVADRGCGTSFNSSCIRVSNLAYASGPVNVALSNGLLIFNNIYPGSTASYSRLQSGTYSVSIARSARPAVNLLNTFISLSPNRVFTLYVLNWNPSQDAIRTLLVEDLR